MVSEIGPELAVELTNFAHDPKKIARIETATTPGDGMQMKPFRLDCLAVPINAGGNMHLEAGLARRTGHGQSVRNEVPVLGNQIEDAPPLQSSTASTVRIGGLRPCGK